MDKKKVSKEEIQIGARVRAVRKANNLTQEQMAERLGMNSTPHYQNIESGRNSLGYKYLRCLKKDFGASSDFILFGEVKNSNDFIFDFEMLSVNEQVDTLMNLFHYLCEKKGKMNGKPIGKDQEEKEEGE